MHQINMCKDSNFENNIFGCMFTTMDYSFKKNQSMQVDIYTMKRMRCLG